LLSKSLTPQLVEMKRIEKWDGVLPQVTGGATPMLGINLGDKSAGDKKKP
jgi:prohibitin 1